MEKWDKTINDDIFIHSLPDTVDTHSYDELAHSLKKSIHFSVIWPELWEATMNTFTMEQMFHHDNQYVDETMSAELWDTMHEVKVR